MCRASNGDAGSIHPRRPANAGRFAGRGDDAANGRVTNPRVTPGATRAKPRGGKRGRSGEGRRGPTTTRPPSCERGATTRDTGRRSERSGSGDGGSVPLVPSDAASSGTKSIGSVIALLQAVTVRSKLEMSCSRSERWTGSSAERMKVASSVVRDRPFVREGRGRAVRDVRVPDRSCVRDRCDRRSPRRCPASEATRGVPWAARRSGRTRSAARPDPGRELVRER